MHLYMVIRSGILVAIALTALGAAQPRRQPIRVPLPGYPAHIVMDTIGEVTTVDAPPARVFSAAQLVLKNMQIPVDLADSATGVVAAARLMRSRNLSKVPLSRYFECGSSMTGPRADSHRITMPLVLFVEPGPDGKSRLRIALIGSAQDVSGVSNTPVACGSTGALEGSIRRAIAAQLQQPVVPFAAP